MESLLSLHCYPVTIPLCTINICKIPPKEEERDMFIRFMEKISDSSRVLLVSFPDVAGTYGSDSSRGSPCFLS
jgi:hypothetical protein